MHTPITVRVLHFVNARALRRPVARDHALVGVAGGGAREVAEDGLHAAGRDDTAELLRER
jgi:hypothetical protein